MGQLRAGGGERVIDLGGDAVSHFLCVLVIIGENDFMTVFSVLDTDPGAVAVFGGKRSDGFDGQRIDPCAVGESYQFHRCCNPTFKEKNRKTFL